MSVLCRISAQDIFAKRRLTWVEQAEEAAVAAEAFPEAVEAVFPGVVEAAFPEAVSDEAEVVIVEAVEEEAEAALAVPVISEV